MFFNACTHSGEIMSCTDLQGKKTGRNTQWKKNNSKCSNAQTLGLFVHSKIYLHLIINIRNIHITKNCVNCNKLRSMSCLFALHDNKIGKLDGVLLP